MDRRNFFKGLISAVVAGTALTASQIATAQGFGFGKYAEMVRLQQDAIAFHLAIKDRNGCNHGGRRLHTNGSYKFHMSNKVDHILGFAMDNFKGDTTSSEAMDECSKIFADRDYADTLTEAGLKRILEVVIPIAVARTLLAKYRIQFDPRSMKNWDRFSDTYQDLILRA